MISDMSVFKPATLVSFFSALAAFIFVPSSSWAVAGLRALLVFAGLFLRSCIAFYLISRMIPASGRALSKQGPEPEGTGAGKFVDLEKQSIDRAKLQELLR